MIKVRNIKCLQNQVAYILGFENLSLWRKPNSFKSENFIARRAKIIVLKVIF